MPVLAGVDMTVEPGEKVGIVGPNGSGKTSLLSVLATLQTPSGGEGQVLGAKLGTRDVIPVRPHIGLSGHQPALYDELSLAENLAHVARLSGIDPVHAEAALDQVGLSAAAGRRASACSNGMRRRADLARLLMIRPRLALLDEAQAGLDATAVAIVDALSARTVADDGAVIMVSHDATQLESRVDRIVRLIDGRTTR